uniref:Uncharacterized protein n=1 Tax=Musa acuminata subsp. malaccensis TaxID=214687 RepID=A0A804IZA9_MUSAM
MESLHGSKSHCDYSPSGCHTYVADFISCTDRALSDADEVRNLKKLCCLLTM